jgi:hypothetical protein
MIARPTDGPAAGSGQEGLAEGIEIPNLDRDAG